MLKKICWYKVNKDVMVKVVEVYIWFKLWVLGLKVEVFQKVNKVGVEKEWVDNEKLEEQLGEQVFRELVEDEFSIDWLVFVNGEVIFQKGENMEDRVQEDGQDFEDGFRGGFLEELYDSLCDNLDLVKFGNECQDYERIWLVFEFVNDDNEDS